MMAVFVTFQWSKTSFFSLAYLWALSILAGFGFRLLVPIINLLHPKCFSSKQLPPVFGSESIFVASSCLPFWTGPVDRGWLWPNIWSAGFYFDPTPYLGLGLGADESKSWRINRISIQAAIFIIVGWDSGFSVMIALLFEEMVVGGKGETHWELQRSNWQEQISWELFPHKIGR